MILYMTNLNEGGSETEENKACFKELHEGENPKLGVIADTAAKGWSHIKNQNMVNYNWAKRRASFK